jgi:hypothetical protein
LQAVFSHSINVHFILHSVYVAFPAGLTNCSTHVSLKWFPGRRYLVLQMHILPLQNIL